MIATPCGPSAVPTGGAGVAAPAGIWILTTAATRFLAMPTPQGCCANGDGSAYEAASELRHLGELELDRRLPAEDVDQHLDLELVLVDLDDLAGEVGEGAFLDPHGLALLVLEAGAALLDQGLLALGLRLQEALHGAPGQRRGLGAMADEAGDAGRVADHVPRVVVEVAAHEQVAREHLLLDDDLLAALELDDVLHRDDDLVDAPLHVHGGGAGLEVLLDLLLVTRLRVHDVPAARAVIRALDRGDELLGVDHALVGRRVGAAFALGLDRRGGLLGTLGGRAVGLGDRLVFGVAGLGGRRVVVDIGHESNIQRTSLLIP